MKPISDIIGEVVDKMRYTGSYTATDSNGITTVISFRHPINELEWVKIDNKDYRVIESDQDTFKIKGTIPASGTWKALAPYYMYGHRLEIAGTLTEMSNDKVYKYQKYPLIALRLDISEKTNKYFREAKINAAIMEFTNQKYKAEQRYREIIIPILYPLYQRFLVALKKYGYLNDLGIPEHIKIDRPFWGTQYSEGNAKNIFNDPIDAVEMIDLKIKVINN
jgi:hypothetical protein